MSYQILRIYSQFQQLWVFHLPSACRFVLILPQKNTLCMKCSLLIIILAKIPEALWGFCEYSVPIYKQCHLMSLGKLHLILPEKNWKMSLLRHRILKDSQLFHWGLTVHRQLRKNLCRCAVSSDFFFLIAFQISQKIVSLVLAVSACRMLPRKKIVQWRF